MLEITKAKSRKGGKKEINPYTVIAFIVGVWLGSIATSLAHILSSGIHASIIGDISAVLPILLIDATTIIGCVIGGAFFSEGDIYGAIIGGIFGVLIILLGHGTL